MAQNRQKIGLRWFDPALVVAVLASAAFYVMVHQPSMHDSLLYRYSTGNVVEYVIVPFFIWGLLDVAFKLLSFPKELLALRQDWLPPRQGREPVAAAAELLERVRRHPQWLLNSRVGRRLLEALEFVTEKNSAEDYREHLKYLADQDDDAAHASYTLIRFIAGVAPVLGFLGTVVHFGTALSGISFDELSERLPVIVGEMGSAFNTTTVALAACMSMLFAMFFCERIDRGIVRSIDRLIDRELLNRFETKDPNIMPFLSVVRSANEEALQAITATLERQIDVWTQTLGALFARFDERQQQEALGWQNALKSLEQRHEAFDGAREDRMRQLVAAVESKQDQHMARIQHVLERLVAFKDDFAGFVKTLDDIARGEGRLVELQAALSRNLHVLRESQHFDEAMHGLTAAIHLLTARYRTGPDSAAA